MAHDDRESVLCPINQENSLLVLSKTCMVPIVTSAEGSKGGGGNLRVILVRGVRAGFLKLTPIIYLGQT